MRDRMPRLEGAREYYVAPDGKPDASGTREAPLDLVTVFTRPGVVQPGDIVWVCGGRYVATGEERILSCRLSGTPGRPVIVRARPGERATLEARITIEASHLWLWGLEITGPLKYGVEIRRGDDIKLINLVIHDLMIPGQQHIYGIAGWDVGNDHEYYGNLLYRCGTTGADHGTYSQNTAAHTVKKVCDNFVFENGGYGLHIWGERPALSRLHVEGNICFCTRNGANILTGGSKPISHLILRNNCTYQARGTGRYPAYGVNVGYTAQGNHNLLIEGNYFTGGRCAMRVGGILSDVTVRRNTFWSPEEVVEATWAPQATRENVCWDLNTYIANGKYSLAAWRQQTGFDENSRLAEGREGRPAGLYVFRRVNHYEPERVHLAVYNWDGLPAVHLDVSDLAPPGTRYRIVNVLDYYGRPVAEGTVTGKDIALPMQGHDYEPEFGAYILFREGGNTNK